MAEQRTTGEPASIEQARAHVEESRARISETLDEIEDRLVEKRHELQEKLDVKKRVREQVDRKPLTMVALAAGAGFLVGMIGRRRSREPERESLDRDELRALLQEVREEDDDGEIRQVRVGRAHPSFWHEARAQLVGALTAALVAAVSERLRPPAEPRPKRRERELDLEDELDLDLDEAFEDEPDLREPRGRWPAADELE